MNEKLKQIAVEAKVEHCISHGRLQEFADLILEECIDIASNTRYDGQVVANRIKFVFGLEE